VANVKYFEMTVTYKNYVHDKSESILIQGMLATVQFKMPPPVYEPKD
jgi:hypothetical protein